MSRTWQWTAEQEGKKSLKNSVFNGMQANPVVVSYLVSRYVGTRLWNKVGYPLEEIKIATCMRIRASTGETGNTPPHLKLVYKHYWLELC